VEEVVSPYGRKNRAFANRFDVALIFSQDQDYTEVAKEVHAISRGTKRWMKLASAFPSTPLAANKRGIDGSDPIRIDQAVYGACIDPVDYRPGR
jgi:GTP cyclohydrolase III